MSKEIIIFASGEGVNFQAIIDTIEEGVIDAKIRCLVTDRLCQAINRAFKHHIDFYVINYENDAERNQRALSVICEDVDLIVCTNYVNDIPDALIEKFPQKIINIHPSLLPDYADLSDLDVHQAVIEAGERESGCTAHYVNKTIGIEDIIEQRFVSVNEWDTPEELRSRVKAEEHDLLINVVSRLLS